MRWLGTVHSSGHTIVIWNCSPFLGTAKLEEISTIESLSFDLTTLILATGNFSEENKLGEGGFGSVYKVTICVMRF